MYDLNAPLTQNYTLGEFLVTNQALSQPNMPSQVSHYDNLVLLAEMKEKLDYYIGKSRIVSAYRSKELQEKLRAQGEPTASGLSFHEVGRAFDLVPTEMSIADFFGMILASPLREEFAEIAIKPSQGALHLAINVPGDVREPKITGLNQEGIYARLGVDEIAEYIKPFLKSTEEAFDEAMRLVSYNKTPLIVTLAAAAGGLAWYLFFRRK